MHGRRVDVALARPLPGLLRLAEWLTPSFYIDFGRPCNSACLYCAVPPHEDAQGFLPFDEVPAIVAAGRDVGCDRAILIGGEPTIYPHLDRVLAALADAGLAGNHIVMTNGLKLADPGFVERLADGGVATLHLSIDTDDDATYDRLSRSRGQLARQRKGLDRALGHGGLNAYVYTAVTRVNVAGLSDLLRSLHDRADRLGLAQPPPIVLAIVKPLGDAARHADELLLGPAEAVGLLRPVLALADRLGITAGVRNVQACLAADEVARIVDYYLDDFSVEVATGQRLPFSHGEYWHKPAPCDGCGHARICTGIYRDVARRDGLDDFRAIGCDGLAEDASGATS